jgi:hypothetical protein
MSRGGLRAVPSKPPNGQRRCDGPGRRGRLPARRAQILATQDAALNRAYAAAPVAVQVRMQDEMKNAETFDKQIGSRQYDSATRQTMQLQSYNSRNSK